MRIVALLLCSPLLASCQTAGPAHQMNLAAGMTAPQAVMAAAEAAPRGVPGMFAFRAKRAEPVGPRFFLNSEEDYRDQRNLSVAIWPEALPELRKRLGPDLRSAFVGRNIQVTGVARRARIDFTNNGRPTGKYYFQTHVDVRNADQIAIVG